MKDCWKLALKIAAIVIAAAAIAGAITGIIIALSKKKAEELPEEYQDYADVEQA